MLGRLRQELAANPPLAGAYNPKRGVYEIQVPVTIFYYLKYETFIMNLVTML